MRTFVSRLRHRSSRPSNILRSVRVLGSLPSPQSVSFSTSARNYSTGNPNPDFNILFFSPRNDRHYHDFETKNPAFIKEIEPKSVSVTDTAHHPQSGYLAIKSLIGQDVDPAMIIPHLVLLAHDKAETDQRIEFFRDAGIKSVLAIRGNPVVLGKTKDYRHHTNGYEEVTDLITRIKELSPETEVIVPAYPTVHPFAESFESDIAELQKKVDSGADRIIMQYCFDNDLVEAFVNELIKRNINLPKVPSIMPVYSPKYVEAFGVGSGVPLPGKVVKIYQKANVQKGDSRILCRSGHEAAIEYTTKQIEGLQKLNIEGVDRINVYSTNNLEALKEVLDNVTMNKNEEKTRDR